MRRPNHRIRPRPLRLVLAFVALLVAGALPAHAQEAPPAESPPAVPTITIDFGDARQPRTRPWSYFDGARDVRQESIQLPDGSTKKVDGITLRSLFAQMRIGSGSFTTVTTLKDDLSEMDVLRTQILQPYGPQVIVFADEQGGLHLLRPQTDADGRGTELATAVDGVLRLTLRSGAELTASPLNARVNELVQFTVTLPAGLDPASVEFEWDFNNGDDPVRSRTKTMSKSFKLAGAYNPTVTLYIGGVPELDPPPPSVEVSVSEAPRVRGRQNSGARESGNRRDHESRRGSGEDTSGGGSGTGTSGGGSDSGAGGTGTTAPPVGAPTAPAPTPSPPATPPPATPRPAPRRERRARAPPLEPAGDTVSGYLLASVDGAPLPAGGAQRTEPDKLVSEADADKPLDIPAVVWVLAGLAALVMLGWALESRTILPYFKP